MLFADSEPSVRWLKESLFSTLDGFDEKAMLQLATLHKPYEKRAVEEVRQLYKILCGSRQCPLVDKIKLSVMNAVTALFYVIMQTVSAWNLACF